MRFRWLILLALIVAWSGQSTIASSEPHFRKIFRFGDNFLPHEDDLFTISRLVSDEDGVLYGQVVVRGYEEGSRNSGFVYSIQKTQNGKRTIKIISSFDVGSKKIALRGGLTYDRNTRSLFGLASIGGDDSELTIFKLSRPTDGSEIWNGEMLTNVPSRVSREPLVISGAGKLYGVSEVVPGRPNCFAVYEASPPPGGSGAWTVATITKFRDSDTICQPSGELAIDDQGVIYGSYNRSKTSTEACGGVFRLTPPSNGGKWNVEVIYRFTRKQPCENNGVTLGANGKLYGGTYDGDQATRVIKSFLYELSPPMQSGGRWTFKKLYIGTDNFGFKSNVTLGPDGSLYGSDSKFYENERVFRLTPPRPGTTKWKMTYMADISNGYNISIPVSVMDNSTVLGVIRSRNSRGRCGGCSQIYRITQ